MDDVVWMVVYLSSGHEKKFAKWLTERAVEVYYPMRKLYTKPSSKRKGVQRTSPAFPGYVFVRVLTGKRANWSVIRSAPGYLYAVSETDTSEDELGRLPLFIPNGAIEQIKIMERKGRFDGVPLSLVFARGTPIEVTEGLLLGKIGVVETPPKDEESPVVATIEGKQLKIPVSLIQIIREDRQPGRFR